MSKNRERLILEKLLTRKQISVDELSKELYTSKSSIRRDLTNLEKHNFLKRVHGGAILIENGISDIRVPFALRELEQGDAKISIAKKAAGLVHDGDVIFLDASSSAYNLIPFLSEKKDITVITNGVKALQRLAEFNIKTICTGGKMFNASFALVGDEAYAILDGINADISFFSCRGMSEDGKLTDITDSENYVRQRMISNSKKSYFLCASEKIGRLFYHNLCTVNDITGVICEKPLPQKLGNRQI